MRRKKTDNLLDDILDHFHPDALNYGGWPVILAKWDRSFIEKEFAGVLEIDGDDLLARVRRVDGSKFKPGHTIRVLRRALGVYKKEANHYYNGLRKLLD